MVAQDEPQKKDVDMTDEVNKESAAKQAEEDGNVDMAQKNDKEREEFYNKVD